MSQFALAALVVESSLKELEKGLSTPGTALSRVLADVQFLKARGVDTGIVQQSMSVWCLAVGGHQEPKKYFYGRSVAEVIQKARKDALGKPTRRKAVRKRSPDGAPHRPLGRDEEDDR